MDTFAQSPAHPNDRLHSFVGGATGASRVLRMETVIGAPLGSVRCIQVFSGAAPENGAGTRWVLRGTTSYVRYVTRAERDRLRARQPALGRPDATCAALI